MLYGDKRYRCPYCKEEFEGWEMSRRIEHEEFWGASIEVEYDVCPFCLEDMTEDDIIEDEDEEEEEDDDT